MKQFIYRALIVFVFLIIYFNSLAQDLIVTNERDSINCQIKKVKQNYIFFDFVDSDGNKQSTVIGVDKTIQVVYGFFDEPIKYVDSNMVEDYSKIRIGFSAGWVYDLSQIDNSYPDFLKEYYRRLKSGYYIKGEIAYFFSLTSGVGLIVDHFGSSANENNVSYVDNNGIVISGSLHDEINMNYIAPSFESRFINSSETVFFTNNLSIGFIDYKQTSLIINESYLIEGKTLGWGGNIGVDMILSPKATIGLNVEILISNLRNVDVTYNGITQNIDLQDNEIINLSRIGIGGTFRFNLN